MSMDERMSDTESDYFRLVVKLWIWIGLRHTYAHIYAFETAPTVPYYSYYLACGGGRAEDPTVRHAVCLQDDIIPRHGSHGPETASHPKQT